MAEYGLTVKNDSGGKRIEIECKHQNGLLYVVPSEASWVCTDSLLHVHALAGFLKQLSELKDQRVTQIMRRWGIYYRTRPLSEEADKKSSGETSESS